MLFNGLVDAACFSFWEELELRLQEELAADIGLHFPCGSHLSDR